VLSVDARRELQPAALEALAGAAAAEAHELRADVARLIGQHDMAIERGQRAVEHDGLSRQPLERARELESERLLRPGSGGAIPLAGTGRGKQGVAAWRGAYSERELVATGDAAGRVNHDRMADVRAFGIERLLHDQRAFVTALCKHA